MQQNAIMRPSIALPRKALNAEEDLLWYRIATTVYPKTSVTKAFILSFLCAILMAGEKSKFPSAQALEVGLK